MKYSLSFEKVAKAEGLALDARGLFSLEEARAVLSTMRTYTRENADVVWGSLLSLESAEEFVVTASSVEWKVPHLRGWDNEDAVTRYGAGVLPWLEALLDRIKGKVGASPAFPWNFVWTHLLAVGPAAVEAVLRVRREGDADPDGLGPLTEFLARHGEPAWQALSKADEAGSPAAKRALDLLGKRNPRVVVKHLKRSRSQAPPLTPEVVLRVLDAAASAQLGERMPWPALRATGGHFEYHAMRVITVREAKGDHWGVLIEVVQGDLLDRKAEWPAVIQQYVYGSKVPASGGRYLVDARPLKVKVKKRPLDAATIQKLDLRPGASITGSVEHWPDVLAIRAALREQPAALFPPPAKVLKVLKVPKAKVVNVTEAFEHVDGVVHGKGALRKLPSESVAWRTLAEALAARDPSKFDPGVPNTDWRLHVGPVS
jgi:hypothetical protein